MGIFIAIIFLQYILSFVLVKATRLLSRDGITLRLFCARYVFRFIQETDFILRRLLRGVIMNACNADHLTLDGCFTFLTFIFPRGPLVRNHVHSLSLASHSRQQHSAAFVRYSHCPCTRLICCPTEQQLSFTTEGDINL